MNNTHQLLNHMLCVLKRTVSIQRTLFLSIYMKFVKNACTYQERRQGSTPTHRSGKSQVDLPRGAIGYLRSDCCLPTVAIGHLGPINSRETLTINKNVVKTLQHPLPSDEIFRTRARNAGRPLIHLSRDMRFPTMWYMRLAKAQTNLRIRAV